MYSWAWRTGSKLGSMIPAEGEAFLTSAMTASLSGPRSRADLNPLNSFLSRAAARSLAVRGMRDSTSTFL